jgi:hypothetical protein
MTDDRLWMAAIGPTTALVEAVAASIGAGMVVGGFLAGVVAGWLMAKRGAELDHRVLMSGYLGGAVGLLALVNDWFRS